MAGKSKTKPGANNEAPAVADGVEAPGFRLEKIDAIALALILGFALLLMIRTGFANGQELWPMPDAVEYAAMSVDIDLHLGPVLHFAGNTYPPRYTIGYPLILAAAYPLVGYRPQWLCLATAFMGLVAIAGLYILALWSFGRPSAIIAAILLSTSPHFLGLSTAVMSDVPSLAVAILAVLAFLYATENASLIASTLCGILVGFAIVIRVTNGAILIGMLAAVLLVKPRRLGLGQLICFAIGIAGFPALQAWENLRFFGSPLSTGYQFWQPVFYGDLSKTFELQLLFFPLDPTYTHGSLVDYSLALLGLDGLLGQCALGTEDRTLLHSHYAFYPFPVAIFAALGIFLVLRRNSGANAMRIIYVGAGFLLASLIIYLPYFYVDPRFFIPTLFAILAAGAYGLVYANRTFDSGWKRFAVIALDLIIAIAIAIDAMTRLATPTTHSKLVADVIAMKPRLKNAIVVSDLSLQWLELFAGGDGTTFVGLNNFYAAEVVTEYHVHWLYEKKSPGSPAPPPVLLPSGRLDQHEAQRLSEADRRGQIVYLLVAMPKTDEWAHTLEDEFDEIDHSFTHETAVDLPEVGLYVLKPR